MIKKILIIIVISIVLYQIYLNCIDDDEKIYKINNIENNNIENIIYTENENNIIENYTNSPDIIDTSIVDEYNNTSDIKLEIKPKNDNSEYPFLEPFGKAHFYENDELGKYYIWRFDNYNPWSQIILRPGNDFPFTFFIKMKIFSIKVFEDWKNIIPNIDFNSLSKELIIPSKDEEGALSVTNLLLNNMNGKLTLENIINKNLIPISVAKAKKFILVKDKLREQIIEIQNNTNETSQLNNIMEYSEDLAENNNISNDPVAFGGKEFTFL